MIDIALGQKFFHEKILAIVSKIKRNLSLLTQSVLKMNALSVLHLALEIVSVEYILDFWIGKLLDKKTS